ncbi:hypothetical protein FGO68_gene8311 [Halteria grandinella]|uniref:Uncharacterized protein n=1 Tax=Halteria grandinella TaxID=5974 RepID=A0A8J8NCY1_HALGN|nr:hypothetical protein FGO68_gene8311 [Halteria grandinella]
MDPSFIEEVHQSYTFTDYINREDVREALHVPYYVPAYRDTYEGLTYLPNFEGSAWIYDIFYKYGYKMLHLMGDADGILSMRGFWKWVKTMEWPVTTEWNPWIYEFEDGSTDILGYQKQWGGKVTLATIHGEGHSGLLTKIFRSKTLVTNFMFDRPLFETSQ